MDAKVRKTGTKERIRDVAIELFSQEGYHAVSIRQIAAKVNISDSTIYSHYKSKEDIMNKIIEYLIDEFRYNSTKMPIDKILEELSPEDAIKNAVIPMIEQLRVPHIRKILRLMCIELYRNETVQDFFKNQYIEPSYELFSYLFQKMMDEGYIMKYDTKLLAIEFFNHCLYLLFECFLINYNENTYDILIDSVIQKLSNHVKFMFDMVTRRE
ncbi:MAG: TetR/AcrR family transcriptional regulator [Promethearchaeota archaeon]